MPQAALGRLQLPSSIGESMSASGFDAASGIRSVATRIEVAPSLTCDGFDAASGIRSVATVHFDSTNLGEKVSMPQAALGRLQLVRMFYRCYALTVSMPQAALGRLQHLAGLINPNDPVSMPQAALGRLQHLSLTSAILPLLFRCRKRH